jgi:TolB protein
MQTDGSEKALRSLEVLKADLIRSGWFTLVSHEASLNLYGSIEAKQDLQIKVALKRTAGGARLFGRSLKGPLTADRRIAHQLADLVVEVVTGKPGMASAKIAIVGNRSGYKELYYCDIDGANLKQVTQDKSIVVAPAWASEGRSILYTSYKKGNPNIYQTGRAQALFGFGGLNTGAALSPDGRYLAVVLSREGNPELYLQEVKSGKLRRLTRTRTANEASPTWSPDGSKLAYVSDRSGNPQVYVMDLQRGNSERISRIGSENVAPDWGANGWLVYSSRQGGRYRLVVVDPQSPIGARTLPLDQADYEDPSWAPDGRHIIASRTIAYRSAIYLLDTQEDPPIALIEGKGDWVSPACTD